MSLTQKIPVQGETTDQLLNVELGGNPYLLRILWNERDGYFALSISTVDEVPILQNIKMVKDYPLLGRFKDPRLPAGDIYFIQEKGKTDRPLYSELGTTHGLYYYEADAVVTAQPVRG